jgi:nucleotide-binding universal stress UspA family protein
MPYADLMISMSLTSSNQALCETVIRLATRFDAGVIGVAACRPIHAVCPEYLVPAGIYEADRKQIDKALRTAEAEFRSALQSQAKRLDWRASTTTAELANHVAMEARSADLLITRADRSTTALDSTRQVDLPGLVMQSARPVLVVPSTSAATAFDHVLVAWKDSREAQRAIADSFPFLIRATQVSLLAISAKEELAAAKTEMAEIALWLGHHGIQSRIKAVESRGTHAHTLDAVADELKANLIVAGAYGYSRQGQWVLGGITSDLLLTSRRCSLLSH